MRVVICHSPRQPGFSSGENVSPTWEVALGRDAVSFHWMTAGVVSVCFLRFYLFEKKREHEQGGEAEGEADSPLSREPDAGLDSWVLGS